jgi:hypothetical protein
MTMRLFGLALLLPTVLTAQQMVERKFAVSPDVSVRIQVPSGTLRVTAWDHDTIAVTGRIPAGGGSFYGGGRGAAAKLGVDGNESGAGPGAELEVRVPRRARLWIKTVTASAGVEGIEGELDVLSVNGSITVSGNPRIASLESIDGAIRVEAGAPVLRVRTSGGTVTVRTRAGDLTVESVGGPIDVSSSALERGRFETVTGAISFTGNLAAGAALEAETHTADLTFRFAGPLNAEFHLSAPGGTILNHLDGKAKPIKGKSLVFGVGTPGAQVTARSFKGTVTITR